MADYLFSIRRDGTAQLDSYEGKDSQIVIPDHYEGKPVTVIADNAFPGFPASSLSSFPKRS